MIYTVDTMGILKEKMPECSFSYIIGADSLCQLHTWRHPEVLITRCRFLVVMRPGEGERETLEAARYWREKGAEIEFLNMEPMDISSTDIRRRVKEGLSISDLVPDSVAAYIAAHGLYGMDGE